MNFKEDAGKEKNRKTNRQSFNVFRGWPTVMVSAEEAMGNNVIIVANPGTGKTEELANYAVDLIRKGVSESEILCLTFTNKAADQMLVRISEKMQKNGIEPYRAFNMEISTFHSYAYRYLGGKGINFTMASNNLLRYAIYRSFKRDRALNYSQDYILGEIVPKVENAIRYVKAFGILPVDIDTERTRDELHRLFSEMTIRNITEEENLKFLEYFVSAYAHYEKIKKDRRNVADHNDLLLMFLKNFTGPVYKYVLVDELQDVSEIEAEIALKSGEKIFAVGDRKQSIFGFQGGSLKNFDRIRNIEGILRLTMGENHRSTANIIGYAKGFFLGGIRNPEIYTELSEFRSSSAEPGEKVSLVASNDPEAEAASMAVSIIQTLEPNEVVAIITRTNSQLTEISRILDRKGIEYSSTNGYSSHITARNDIMDYITSIFSDDPETKLRAIFSPFSGIPLRDAFAISERTRGKIWAKEELDGELSGFPYMAPKPFSREDLYGLFTGIILPISVSISREYFSTAMAIYSNIKEFFETSSELTMNAFMDYLATTDETFDVPEKKSKLLLTTVHKAKGMGFTHVLYVPKDTRKTLSFVDAVSYSIIRAVKGVDVREEIYDESERIDFVAFTRAKKTLGIVANESALKRYYVPGYCEKKLSSTAEDIQPVTMNFDEAYASFVNGNYEKAKAILNSDGSWIRETISSFFAGKSRLSYSLVKATKEPYRFLKSYIIAMFYGNEAMKLGSRVHENAQRDFLNELEESDLEAEEKVYLENTRIVNEKISTKYNARQVGSEESITLPVSSLFPSMGVDNQILFTGKLDAVFRSEGTGTTIILDYKTDKTRDYLSEHMQQLSVYGKLFSVKHGLKEGSVSVAVGYIGLRGKINLGRIECDVVDSPFNEKYLDKFSVDLGRYLEYRKNPDRFIDDLLAEDESDSLYQRIKQVLAAGRKGA